VPDYAIIIGNPGKVIGWVCRCGEKLNFKKDVAKCGICNSSFKKSGDKIEER